MRYILFPPDGFPPHLAAMLCVALTACATPIEFTEGAKRVRVITPAVAHTAGCQHLGLIRAWRPVLSGGMLAAQIAVRNGVAERGGNALVVQSQYRTGEGHGEILGDAYRCNFQ